MCVVLIVMKRWQRASMIICRIRYVYVCMLPLFTFIGALTSIFVAFEAFA